MVATMDIPAVHRVVSRNDIDRAGLPRFGLPPASPSLGEMAVAGQGHVGRRPWLGFTGFFSVAIMLSLLIFIGEAVARRLRPRKTFQVGSAMDAINQPLLGVRDLSVASTSTSGTTAAVDRVSFEIKRGELRGACRGNRAPENPSARCRS